MPCWALRSPLHTGRCRKGALNSTWSLHDYLFSPWEMHHPASPEGPCFLRVPLAAPPRTLPALESLPCHQTWEMQSWVLGPVPSLPRDLCRYLSEFLCPFQMRPTNRDFCFIFSVLGGHTRMQTTSMSLKMAGALAQSTACWDRVSLGGSFGAVMPSSALIPVFFNNSSVYL